MWLRHLTSCGFEIWRQFSSNDYFCFALFFCLEVTQWRGHLHFIRGIPPLILPCLDRKCDLAFVNQNGRLSLASKGQEYLGRHSCGDLMPSSLPHANSGSYMTKKKKGNFVQNDSLSSESYHHFSAEHEPTFSMFAEAMCAVWQEGIDCSRVFYDWASICSCVLAVCCLLK